MAIDYGDVRVGIALTDPLKIIASGYKTLKNDANLSSAIYEICKEKTVTSIVIGLPYDQNSNIGIAAKKVINQAVNLKEYMDKKEYAVTYFEQDERYTTRDAVTSMRDVKTKRNKKKEVVDQIAAANILREFLSSNYKTPFKFPI